MNEMSKKATITPKEIRDSLEEEILKGEFIPGSKLDEGSLSKKFSVSRTPIREALRQLSASGLIELIPNRGAFLVQLSTNRLVEMFEVLAELEGMCGRLAARRITDAQRKELMESLESCRKSEKDQQEVDAYYHSNDEFHSIIHRATQNQFLIDTVENIERRLRPYRRVQLHVPQRKKDSVKEHGLIVEAILAGEAELAEKRMQGHILVQGERFNDFLALLNSASSAS
jgi:DNA-binding GntR family transcriptional regulator